MAREYRVRHGRGIPWLETQLLYCPPNPEQEPYLTQSRGQQLLQLGTSWAEKAQSKQGSYYNCQTKTETFQVEVLVYLRTYSLSQARESFAAKLAGKWKVPAKLRKQLGPVTYWILFRDSHDR